MHFPQLLAALASLAAVAQAVDAPSYSGFTRNFNANFMGAQGSQPNKAKWIIPVGDSNDNNEFQRGTASTTNLRYSNRNTLEIIPLADPSAPKGWTSARLESQYTVTPKDGRLTRVEASLRVGGNSANRKQGIWYAFWMMGEAYRKGVAWPGCGEVDIFENINGQKEGYGVVHCDSYPNGICNEPQGLVDSTTLPDIKFHVWRIEFDRRNSDFKKQTMIWYLDDVEYHRVTGAQVNDANVWATLTAKPLYFIANVSVGGNWV